MNIPTKVKIGGHILKVRLAEFADDDTLCGENTPTDGEIVINKKLPQSQIEATFIHEAMHTMNTTIDHVLLDSLSEQIYQFLKDNKLIA
mgnify:CR=1 FL=1